MVRENIPASGRDTELENCTFVKTVLMLLVVLGHCVMYWTGEWFVGAPVHQAKGLTFLADWINSFHIYGFALISGYLFYHLKFEKEKYSTYGPFLAKKARRLLIPYTFASSVWVIPFVCIFYPVDFGMIFRNFVLGIAPQQLWFLLMLFGVFLMMHPLSAFLKERHILGGAVVLCAYGIGLLGQAVLPNLFQIFTACRYLPVFWCGFKLRQMSTGGGTEFAPKDSPSGLAGGAGCIVCPEPVC